MDITKRRLQASTTENISRSVKIAVKHRNRFSKQSPIRSPYQLRSNESTANSITKTDLLKSQPSELLTVTDTSNLRSSGGLRRKLGIYLFSYPRQHHSDTRQQTNRTTTKKTKALPANTIQASRYYWVIYPNEQR